MKNSTSIMLSLIFLFVFMTIGLVLLAFSYTGPRFVALLVFIAYVFITYFLFKTTLSLVKSLKESEKGKGE